MWFLFYFNEYKGFKNRIIKFVISNFDLKFLKRIEKKSFLYPQKKSLPSHVLIGEKDILFEIDNAKIFIFYLAFKNHIYF